MQTFTPPIVAIRIYTALITQTGTEHPTAIVIHDTTKEGIIWQRTGVGTYEAQRLGNETFKENKVAIFTQVVGANRMLQGKYIDFETLEFKHMSSGGVDSDNIAEGTLVEIRFYDNN